jgi:hypothetical protein
MHSVALQGLTTVNMCIERLQAKVEAADSQQGVIRWVKLSVQPEQLSPNTQHGHRVNVEARLRQPADTEVISKATVGTGPLGSIPQYK